MKIIGAFQSDTNLSEPDGYNDISEGDIAAAEEKPAESEASTDNKTLFVAAEVSPNDKERVELCAKAVAKGVLRSGLTSVEDLSKGFSGVLTAELTIDGAVTYTDIYDINSQSGNYWYSLKALGFNDSGDAGIIRGEPDEPYKVIFAFSIEKTTIDSAKILHVSWNDFEADFDASKIVTLDSPTDAIEALS